MIATITSAGIEAPISYGQVAAYTALVFLMGVGAGLSLIHRRQHHHEAAARPSFITKA